MAGIDPRAIIEEFLDSHSLEFDRVDEKTFLITLPGEKKLETHVAFIVGDYSLTVSAFVIRKPDENCAQVHQWCLEKNSKAQGVAFAINQVGDIFLVGQLPLAALSEREIDRILGAILQSSDSSFNPLLEMGFSSAIRREWAWRVSRGESLANLAEFAHLI